MEILERDTYLMVLNRCLEQAAAGSGRIALVSGEAGIGKTTLVQAFANQHRAHVRVLWGICDPLFTPRPLGPLHDIADQIGGQLQGVLASSSDRTGVFSALLKALQSQPTITVFEDLHWADEGTLDLLRYIGRRITQTSSLLVVTYRDDELTFEHPLRIALGDLLTSQVSFRILLPPLSEQAVQQLIGERQIEASHLHQRTGGNPFFITEVLNSQLGGIPATIRDAVLARAARLSSTGRNVLEIAAVIGPRFELALLARLAGEDIMALEECLLSGMLISQGRLISFRHELARQTLIEMLSPQRSQSLHQQVLAALTAEPEKAQNLAEIAYHAEAVGDHPLVLKTAPSAARQAAAQWAHREAAALYALALRFADELPAAEHAALLEAYARECNLTERQRDGIAALRQALDLWAGLGDTLKQGHILSFLAIMLRNHGRFQEAEQCGWQAIALLETVPPGRELAQAYRVQATLRLSQRDIDEALQWGEKALELAETFEARDVQATAHVAVGSAHLFKDYEFGCAYLERQLEAGKDTWHERYVANLLAYLGSCSVELYRFQRAEHYLTEGIAYTFERRLDIFNRFMQAWLAITCLRLGRWEEANEIISQSSEMPPRSVFSRVPTLVATGLLRAWRGDPGALHVLEEALVLAEPSGSLAQLGLVYTARAEAAWLAGDRRRAAQEARAGYELAAKKQHPWLAGELAVWLRRTGERVQVEDWLAPPFRQQLVGDWRAAAAEWQERRCPYLQAWALAEGEAQAKLSALEIFEQLGAHPAAQQLRSELQAAGALGLPTQPHASTRSNPFGLTNRQLEVLALLAEDLSNAEIATRLHISPKTVDHHVSAILGKLQVTSRTEAATLARDHPQFPKK